jgi:hypothetical protein
MHCKSYQSCSPYDMIDSVGSYLCLNNVPPLPESGSEHFPHLPPTSQILLSKQFQFLIVPVLDMTTLDKTLVSLTAGVRGFVWEVFASYGLPVQTRSASSEEDFVVGGAPDSCGARGRRGGWCWVGSGCHRCNMRGRGSHLLGHDSVERGHMRLSCVSFVSSRDDATML